MDSDIHYVGISGSKLPVEEFDLGRGVSLHRTFAHLMAPCLMAFSPAEDGKIHPAPWRAARGGFAFDITIELRVSGTSKSAGLDAIETASWIMALLRLAYAPYLTAPVTIDMPFSDAAKSLIEPTIQPLEVQERNFFKSDERPEEIPIKELEWLKGIWLPSALLAKKHPQLLTAVYACDSCRVRTRVSQSVLTIWGALEQIFAPSSGELRHRVAANLAAYLEPRGPERLATYKHVLKLYNDRSIAAHSAKELDQSVMMASWVILRNALVKMISENHVPSSGDLEHLLYADLSTPAVDAISWGGRPQKVSDPP